jgi:hypothetical protein
MMRALRWLPALVAAAYVATVLAEFSHLVHALYWDSDASSLPVLAERLRGNGPVVVPHFGSWTSLWWMLATRSLPGHVQLWQATGYPFALAGAALVGWATARVAGLWAGVTAGAVGLIVGPFAVRSQLTLTYHVVPPFTAAVLAAYLVLLRQKRSIVFAIAAGLLAGVNAASDPLTWLAAVAPFAFAAGLLAVSTRRRDIVARGGVTVALAVGAAISTNAAMRAFDFHVPGLAVRAARIGDLPSNARQLARMVALLGGANYALPGGYPPEPVRVAVGLLAVAAVAVVLLVAVKGAIRRAEPLTLAYGSYWAAVVLFLALSFVGTTNASALGAGSMNYLLTFALAAGAGVGLLAARSRRIQLAVAFATALVGAVNIAGILDGHAGTPEGAIGRYERPLVDLLDRKGVTRGYAGYWDASNLTWQSRRRVAVAPVSSCADALCAFNYFTIRSWYDRRAEPSFLIVDPTTAFVTEPPPVVRDATATYRFGPLRLYVFPYDLATHIHAGT